MSPNGPISPLAENVPFIYEDKKLVYLISLILSSFAMQLFTVFASRAFGLSIKCVNISPLPDSAGLHFPCSISGGFGGL